MQTGFSCCCSFSQLCLILPSAYWTAAHQSSLSFTVSQNLLKLKFIELVMPSNHLILCCPPSPPALNLSQHQCLSLMVLDGIKWYWSFSFSVRPSSEYSGLISFRIDWFDLLAIQGTLKNLVQHHCSKISIFLCPAFFMVQFSHLYMTTGKTVALTIWTLFGKVMSLLFKTRHLNMAGMTSGVMI